MNDEGIFETTTHLYHSGLFCSFELKVCDAINSYFAQKTGPRL